MSATTTVVAGRAPAVAGAPLTGGAPDTRPLDSGAVQAFGERLVAALDGASVAVLVSLGHQAGLFETMARLPAATSPQVAAAAGLHERYVREWLDGMTVAGVLAHDPSRATYALPPEHALLLTRAGGADNLAPGFQLATLMGSVEQQVLGCFRHGGGLPYAAYPRLQAILAENAAAFADHVLDRVLRLVDGLVERLVEGIDVLDAGCGSGHAVNAMAAAYPASRFTGYDLSVEALATARADAARRGLDNVTFVEQDLAAVDVEEAFDLVTAFDVVHDQAQPRAVLAALHRACRPGAVLLVRDIKASSQVENNVDLPWATFLYAMSTTHCMSVSLAAGGEGLGTAWGEELAVELIRAAGFTGVTVTGVEGDPMNNCYLATRSA